MSSNQRRGWYDLFSLLEVLAIARRTRNPHYSRETKNQLRINERIRISPIRLIDENDEQVGVIDTHEAIMRAREVDLDLVEVSPNASPPVCKIMDYGKWKYQQKKKEQKARSHAKQSELKGIRLRPKTDEHDLMIKTSQARKFLAEGHKVQFTMIFKGREMAHRDRGTDALNLISQELADCSTIESPARMAAGRRMILVLAPGTTKKKTEKQDASQPAAQESTPVPAAAANPAPEPAESTDA